MKTEIYLQIVPEYHPWRPNEIAGVKIAKTTKNRPENIVDGARVVKVVLDVPAEQFLTQAVEVQAPDVPAVRAVS